MERASSTTAEPPCVWVTAGVLSYRLCDREFDCEHCPLHLALRGGQAAAPAPPAGATTRAAARGDDAVGRCLATLGADCALHLDRAYSPEGLWLTPDADGVLHLGLDDYTLRLLAPVDGVVLPRVGVWLEHGAPCAWINRGRLAIALRCPIAGEVTAVHPRPALAAARPGAPATERWWFRLRPHEPLDTAAGLLRHEALVQWYLERVHAVHEQLDAVMTPTPDGVGALAADGGLPVDDIEKVLGRERFETLVHGLFPAQI